MRQEGTHDTLATSYYPSLDATSSRKPSLTPHHFPFSLVTGPPSPLPLLSGALHSSTEKKKKNNQHEVFQFTLVTVFYVNLMGTRGAQVKHYSLMSL